jgi:hypothetical protein
MFDHLALWLTFDPSLPSSPRIRSFKQQPNQRKRQKRGKINGRNNAKMRGKLDRKIALGEQKQIGQIHSKKHDTAQIQSSHKNAKYAAKIPRKLGSKIPR